MLGHTAELCTGIGDQAASLIKQLISVIKNTPNMAVIVRFKKQAA